MEIEGNCQRNGQRGPLGQSFSSLSLTKRIAASGNEIVLTSGNGCFQRKVLDNIDLNQMSHRYMSAVSYKMIEMIPSTSAADIRIDKSV